ncbi:hypothetical protein OC844_004848 [Tilletia horrida]|nr:hypothetical protein OC844_004848 [Tilletia horrida]
MPSPSWVGPQATPSNAVAAASTAFVTASPLARRLSIIEAWSCWDLSNPQSPSVVVTAFHQLAELIPDAGPPFASLLHSVKSLLHTPGLDQLCEVGINPFPILHRVLTTAHSTAEALAAAEHIVQEGTATALCIILVNTEIIDLRNQLQSWAKQSDYGLARRRAEHQRLLLRHEDQLIEALRKLLTMAICEVGSQQKDDGAELTSVAQQHFSAARRCLGSQAARLPLDRDEAPDVKALISSSHGRTTFRHLSRSLRPLRQRTISHSEDDFRLPSAALSPVIHAEAMTPLRDSFALPPVDATARELVQRLEDLDTVFKTLDFDSPALSRPSITESEDAMSVEVDTDSDLDSLHEASVVKSPRLGTPQLLSLVDDLVSNLNELAPRAMAQKLYRLSTGLNALRRLPVAAVAIATFEVALYRKQSLLETPAGRADLVNALDNLATALENAGRVEESVPLTEEAVGHLRSLRDQHPHALQATLGVSLLKLVRRLAMVGKYTDALVTSDEALQIFRSLDGHDHQRFKADLASALFAKAACLHLLGRRQPAMAACKEALTLRKSACSHESASLPSLRALAESHLQLSEFCSQDNDVAIALQACVDAIKVLRSSVKRDDVTNDLLATAQLVYATNLRQRHQVQRAAEATREAVQIYRTLSTHDGDAYGGLLARALCRLGQDELDLHPSSLTLASPRLAEHPALITYAEAVSSLRPLSIISLAEYGTDLAKALLAYSTCLSTAGRERESVSVVRESLQILKDVARQFPLNEDDYVKGLLRLSAALSREGTPQEGLAVSEELVEMQRKRAAIQPEAYQADLARALCNHSFFLDAAGKGDEALQICEESVQVLRVAVARNDGKATRTDLALAVRQLAGRHRAAGQMQEALGKLQEAVELMRSVSERQSGLIVDLSSSEVNLGRSLRDLAIILGSLERHDQGVLVVKDSVRVFRTLEAMEPGMHQIDLAKSLNEMANRLAEAGQRLDAVYTAKEAVALWQDINQMQEPQPRHLPDLAFSTWALSRRLSDMEEFGEAARTIEPAVSIFSELAKEQPERWQTHLEGAMSTQMHLLHESGQPIRAFSQKRNLKRLKNKQK